MPRPTASRRWTYEDYLALPEDGRQHQIIGGEHFVTAAPRLRHQVVAANLNLLLANHAREHALGLVLFAPVDFVLSEFDVVQPDLIFISAGRLDIVGDTHVAAAPDLAIEILSPSTRDLDLRRKRELYERSGVREYWIVDPDRECVEALQLAGERFGPGRVFRRSAEDILESSILAGLELPLAEIFG